MYQTQMLLENMLVYQRNSLDIHPQTNSHTSKKEKKNCLRDFSLKRIAEKVHKFRLSNFYKKCANFRASKTGTLVLEQ